MRRGRREWKFPEVDLTCQVAAVGGADFGERMDSVLGAEHDGLGGVVEVGVRCAVQGAETLRGGRLGVRQLSAGRRNTKTLTPLTQKTTKYI